MEKTLSPLFFRLVIMNRNLGDGDQEWIKLPIKLDLGVSCDLSHGIYSCSLGAGCSVLFAQGICIIC